MIRGFLRQGAASTFWAAAGSNAPARPCDCPSRLALALLVISRCITTDDAVSPNMPSFCRLDYLPSHSFNAATPSHFGSLKKNPALQPVGDKIPYFRIPEERSSILSVTATVPRVCMGNVCIGQHSMVRVPVASSCHRQLQAVDSWHVAAGKARGQRLSRLDKRSNTLVL